jgi:hypothetical protein
VIPVNAFKAALIAALQADDAVAGILGARIYDEPPRDKREDEADLVASPWAYLGPISATRVASDCGPGWELRIRIFTASADFGRDKVWDAMNAILDAIDSETFTLTARGLELDVFPVLESDGDQLEGSDGAALYSSLPRAFHALELIVHSAGDIIDPLNPKRVYADLTAIIAEN